MQSGSTTTETKLMEEHSQPFRALVADDETLIRQLLRAILEREGFEVSEAEDGTVARSILTDESIDLVISDVQMPGESGIDLLEFIQKEYPGVPIILITGQPDVEAAVECIKTGAVDYLTKPFDIHKLRRLVRETVTESSQRKAGNFEGGGGQRILAGYHLLERLGEGSAGIVFLARKAGSPAAPKRALKILKLSGHGLHRRDEMLERFLHEARAASKVDHPNIIRFVEHGLALEENVPYLVMEYFPAKPLDEVMETIQAFSLQAKLRIIRQMAEALGAIHSQGICHRDVKPGNAMLDEEEMQVKMMDFGIARLPESELTRPDVLMGTPAYMAPESFLSSRVTPAADIFSLGAMSYEILLGRKPFPGKTVQVLAREITEDNPVLPRSIVSDFPPPLESMLAMMLKKSPDQRYSSVQELIRDIDLFLDSDRNAAPGSSVWRRLKGRFSSDWS